MLQLLIMLIPAYLQIGLCLSCVSPAVNKDILGIIAIFEGRLYSSVLLGALPGLDPGPLGSVWGALMVGGRAQSPGCVLAGASSPSPRPPTCERSLHGRELSPCFLEKILKCLSKGLIMGLGTNQLVLWRLKELEFPTDPQSTSENTSSQIRNSDNPEKACFAVSEASKCFLTQQSEWNTNDGS